MIGLFGIPRDGDQLRFDLFRKEPWDGRAPRVLTRGFKSLFSRHKPPSREVCMDLLQLDLFDVEVKPPEVNELSKRLSSPSLLPLLELRGRRSSRRGSHKRGYHGETT